MNLWFGSVTERVRVTGNLGGDSPSLEVSLLFSFIGFRLSAFLINHFKLNDNYYSINII